MHEIPSEHMETFLTVRAVKHWHKFLKDIVESLSMEIFVNPLGIVLDSLL